MSRQLKPGLLLKLNARAAVARTPLIILRSSARAFIEFCFLFFSLFAKLIVYNDDDEKCFFVAGEALASIKVELRFHIVYAIFERNVEYAR